LIFPSTYFQKIFNTIREYTKNTNLICNTYHKKYSSCDIIPLNLSQSRETISSIYNREKSVCEIVQRSIVHAQAKQREKRQLGVYCNCFIRVTIYILFLLNTCEHQQRYCIVDTVWRMYVSNRCKICTFRAYSEVLNKPNKFAKSVIFKVVPHDVLSFFILWMHI
jgi:hypothetical protein